MARKSSKSPRVKIHDHVNLSEYSLDINLRKCNYNKFNFKEIEDFVSEIAGSRKYQFEAIKDIMTYLWGGGYNNVKELVRENYQTKPQLKQRFATEELFLHHLPLPDRLSGVVHMATGTGKSYVIFAVAYLSVVMGFVKRVLVLGPSSTIIEEGLRKKFRELMGEANIISKLPLKYQNVPVSVINSNQPADDNTIMIENINAVFTKERNSIGDTLFKDTNEVLVLSDEVHHAYSHLRFAGNGLAFDFEEGSEGRGDEKNERLWMKFLRTESKIKRHVGFTGTPYNQDEYFCDVIYNYSIKQAEVEKYIKTINPIIRTESNSEGEQLNSDQRYELILKKHTENKEKYSYKDKNGKAKLKPITIFVCRSQQSASTKAEEFIQFLAKYSWDKEGRKNSLNEYDGPARKQVICVISDPSSENFQHELDTVEDLKNKVEFIFSVNKLSEGWDVDNVFQIVPMEERAFNSKLLISQVLGRGLRLPRNPDISAVQIAQNYPVLAVTNHEKFADHIMELVAAVTNCEVYLNSNPIPKKKIGEQSRDIYHFNLFNLNYIPATKLEELDEKEKQQSAPKNLILTSFNPHVDVNIIRRLGDGKYKLSKNLFTVDEVVYELVSKFKLTVFEQRNFNFGTVILEDTLPTEDDIRKVIKEAMKKAFIEGDYLSEENRKQINLFFNQFLPRSKKKQIITNIDGDLKWISTINMDKASVKSSDLDKDAAVFLSEDYEKEVDPQTKVVLEYIIKSRERANPEQMSFIGVGKDEFLERNKNIIRSLAKDNKPPFIVNTSKFKTPLDIIPVSHTPEKLFVFGLIENSDYVESWVKSRDMNFYSIEYEYWKGGKDRVRRSFNPDFFIKINLNNYIEKVKSSALENDLRKLEELQNQGIKEIIKVVEIKSDEDDDEATPAKAEWAKEHFERLNNKIKITEPVDVDKDLRENLKQHYTFDLITPEIYFDWFLKLQTGAL